jgi:hypothetical protein
VGKDAIESDGEVDTQNRYAATVMVSALMLGTTGACNGALVTPSLVLTAGRCVCARQVSASKDGPPPLPVGAMACAQRAVVTIVTYEQGDSPYRPGMHVRFHEGTVRPHPEFNILSPSPPTAVIHADLAVIVLDKPLGAAVPLLPAADEDVRPGESLITAGYGDIAMPGRLFGLRYFRKSKVSANTSYPEGPIRYEQEGTTPRGNYAGGPCIREGKRGPRLIGIAGLGTDAALSFTSIRAHSGWLRSEIDRAARKDTKRGRFLSRAFTCRSTVGRSRALSRCR